MSAQLEAVKLPIVLQLQLKRFNFEGKIGFKNSQHYSFDEEFVFDNKKYKLFAVIAHAGTVLDGHYIAYVNFKDDEWKCYDDDKVYFVPKQRAINDQYGGGDTNGWSAYILWYVNVACMSEVQAYVEKGAVHTESLERINDFITKFKTELQQEKCAHSDTNELVSF